MAIEAGEIRAQGAAQDREEMRANKDRAAKPPLDQARDALLRECPFDSAIVFWRGTSGHEYVHTIYRLTGCPAVPPACVMLVRATGTAPRMVLKVMCVDHNEQSLNLAEIRHTGAQLGADEVHLHFATGNRYARQTAAFDLRTQHGGIEIVGDEPMGRLSAT